MVDKGFEGRSGLAPGHCHSVEGAFFVIDPSHHRQNIPGTILHGDHRPVEFGIFGVLFVTFKQAVKTVLHCLPGRLLRRQIDRGIDLVTTGADIPQFSPEAAQHLIHDIRRHILAQGGMVDLGHLLGRLAILRFGDPSQALHPVENGIGPVEDPFVVATGIIVARRIGQAHQNGNLFEGQIFELFVEIALGGGFDPVVVVAVGDFVEIALDNLLFAQDILDLDGQDRLFDLPGQFFLTGEELVLDQLLGQRGTSFHEMARLDIGDKSTDNGVGVDAVVFEETGIFRGDQRLHQLGRKFVKRGVEAMTALEDIGQMPPMPVQDFAGELGAIIDDLLGIELHLLIGVDKSPHQCHKKKNGQKDGAFDKAIDHVRNSLLAKLASTRRRV